MEKYLNNCRKLSLTARAAIGIIVFERFCIANKIESAEITEFIDYMWKWPLIDGPDQFNPWQESRPKLVDYGLGDPADQNLNALLSSAQICEENFRGVLSGVVEILWGSFWGAAEDNSSLDCLRLTITSAAINKLPPLTPFKFSRYSEGSGWGNKISSKDYKFWRGCIQYT